VVPPSKRAASVCEGKNEKEKEGRKKKEKAKRWKGERIGFR